MKHDNLVVYSLFWGIHKIELIEKIYNLNILSIIGVCESYIVATYLRFILITRMAS